MTQQKVCGGETVKTQWIVKGQFWVMGLVESHDNMLEVRRKSSPQTAWCLPAAELMTAMTELPKPKSLKESGEERDAAGESV